jgi:hypothetical protein
MNMKRIFLSLTFFLALAIGAQAQIIKGAGIVYFDSLLNVNANTAGSEYAASIKLKKLYRWDRGTSQWVEYGTGEINTASNLGAGTGLFAGKVGIDLQFKGLAVGPNLSISSNSTTVTISQSYAYYTNDAAAASGGVAIGSVYRVDIGNPYGMTWGTLKTRNE